MKRKMPELSDGNLAAMNQMATALGHELSNFLGLINASAYYLKMVRKNSEGEKEVKYLDAILSEVQAASKLINDAIAYSKPIGLKLEQGSISGLISKILSSCAPPANIELISDLKSAPRDFYFDAEQLGAALANLIVNACQAMPQGGKLKILCGSSGKACVVQVEDTGGGLPKKYFGNFFTPFFSTKPRALGIGLSYAKRVINSHGGSIALGNKAEGGCRVTVKIPLRMAPLKSKKSYKRG